MTFDPGTLALLGAAMAGAGVIAGLLAGLLGVGGGIVIVPTLYHIFSIIDIDDEVKMHLAVGTSLSTIIATSIISARSHHRRGAVDVDLLKSWAPWVAIGVGVGAVIAGYASAEALMSVFAVVGLVVALNMAVSRDPKLAEGLPNGMAKTMIASTIGGVSTLMGIGGGTLTVPILVMFNYPIRRAVGTASALGLIIAVPGTIAFLLSGIGAPDLPPFSLGYVNLLGFALLVPITMAMAPVGARIAHTIDTRMLRLAFAVFLAITALRMLIDIF